MRRIFAALAFAAATVFGPTPSFAASTLSDESASFENVTPENVSALLNELGAGNVTSATVDNHKVVRFTSGAVPFNIILLCDEGKCMGLYMVVNMLSEGGRFPLESLNAYNQKDPFVSVSKFEDKLVQISRVVVTEGGVTKKNVAINIAEFVSSADASIKFLMSQLVAGYRPDASSPFDRVNFEPQQLRPAFLNPNQVAAIAASFKSRHRTSLRSSR